MNVMREPVMVSINPLMGPSAARNMNNIPTTMTKEMKFGAYRISWNRFFHFVLIR